MSTQKNFYNSVDPEYLKAESNKPYARFIVGIIQQWISKQDAILEVGAGQGRFTFELSHHVQTVLATDISENEIDSLKKKIQGNNIQASVLDLTRIQMQKKSMFDSVVGFFILHHVPDFVESVARNVSKHLKKGGRMIFVENNPISPWHLLAILLRRDMTWEIEKGTYTSYIGRFLAGCTDAGMRVKIVKKFGFFPPEIINRYPFVTKLHSVVEKIPGIRDIFCPFILVVVEKA